MGLTCKNVQRLLIRWISIISQRFVKIPEFRNWRHLALCWISCDLCVSV